MGLVCLGAGPDRPQAWASPELGALSRLVGHLAARRGGEANPPPQGPASWGLCDNSLPHLDTLQGPGLCPNVPFQGGRGWMVEQRLMSHPTPPPPRLLAWYPLALHPQPGAGSQLCFPGVTSVLGAEWGAGAGRAAALLQDLLLPEGRAALDGPGYGGRRWGQRGTRFCALRLLGGRRGRRRRGPRPACGRQLTPCLVMLC